ncbi:hypothetical protein [Clostridium botulinum]|uniref:hypothetical protein n=1 Tax=Clostridium botulinum TaxID=1491 RepID=UPI0009477243|nr:hypothetical protein [Clostridium botulinum]APQ78597.1 hypothetical protein RSJ10_3784 [Clostridium botulinum]MBN3355843.1 hypothetical protein [Clostridium botulinum]
MLISEQDKKDFIKVWKELKEKYKNDINNYRIKLNLTERELFTKVSNEAFNMWEWNCMCDCTYMGYSPSTFMEDELIKELKQQFKTINLGDYIKIYYKSLDQIKTKVGILVRITKNGLTILEVSDCEKETSYSSYEVLEFGINKNEIIKIEKLENLNSLEI